MKRAVAIGLCKVDSERRVYDLIIEDVSLVNTCRAQFSRVLSRASFDELLRRMRQKAFSSPLAQR
jgi:ABC-type transporter MlaC component